jgi:hypothetical protein
VLTTFACTHRRKNLHNLINPKADNASTRPSDSQHKSSAPARIAKHPRRGQHLLTPFIFLFLLDPRACHQWAGGFCWVEMQLGSIAIFSKLEIRFPSIRKLSGLQHAWQGSFCSINSSL